VQSEIRCTQKPSSVSDWSRGRFSIDQEPEHIIRLSRNLAFLSTLSANFSVARAPRATV